MSVIQGIFAAHNLKLPDQKYEILTVTDIKDNEIQKLIGGVLEVFEDVSPKQCEALLFYFKWDPEHLLEKYFEADSFEQFLSKNDINLDVIFSDAILVDSYIQTKPLYKCCPKDTCDRLVKLESADVEDITCTCGLSYCFKCSDIPHSPFPCMLIEKWKQQIVEYEQICNERGVVCPQCKDFTFVVKLDPDYYCSQCAYSFYMNDDYLIANNPTVFPEYKYHLSLLEKIESIRSIKADLEKRDGSYEFLSTANKYAQIFLQKLFLLPAFIFFLDRDYLSMDSSAANKLAMIDLHKTDLEPCVEHLMTVLKIDSLKRHEFADTVISKQEQNNILDVLYAVQQKMDTLFNYIKETGENWIFKLPEIREINEENRGVWNGMDQVCVVDACN